MKQNITPNFPAILAWIALFSASFVSMSQAVNHPVEASLKITGGHVVVNDDDANDNQEWDYTETPTSENPTPDTGLIGPNTQEKSEPKLQKFSFTAKHTHEPGILVVNASSNNHIKLWKYADKSEEFVSESEGYPVSITEDRIVEFFVEGLKATAAFDSIEFTAVYTVKDKTINGRIKFGVTQADIDVDSDNNAGLTAIFTDEDDKIEFSKKSEYPGKIINQNQSDIDADGVVDNVDGLSLPNSPSSVTATGLILTPMRVTLQAPFNPSTAKLKFTYTASIPRTTIDVANGPGNISVNGPLVGGKQPYIINKKGLRLWKVNGYERKSGKNVGGTNGGDFIPAGEEISWADIVKEGDTNFTTIYVEFVNKYLDIGDNPDESYNKNDIVLTITDPESAKSGYIEILGKKTDLTGKESPDGVVMGLLSAEIITDMNNDGQITISDSQARDASYGPLPPLTLEVIEKGTEFLFVNDERSNGMWDGEDTDPDKPASEKDDDDAQEIEITPAIANGEVWLEHPSIARLSFYKTRECKASDKVNLSLQNKFVVTENNPFPNKLFVRSDVPIAFPNEDNPQINGDLVLKIKLGGVDGLEFEAQKMRLTIVEELGAENYFHAVRDYILENNTKTFKHRKGYALASAYTIVAMREESSMMFGIDTYDHVADKARLEGIDEVKANYEADVIINGNQCFKFDGALFTDIPYPGGMTDRCDGRLCVAGSILRPPSDDTHSPNLGGVDAKYVGVTSGLTQLFTFVTGRVPESDPTKPTPDQGMGGLTATYDRAELQVKENQLIGRAPVTEPGKGIVFIATNPSGIPGKPILLAADAKNSGVQPLAGGAPGSLELLFLDGSSSVGLVLANPDGVQKTIIKGEKHNGAPYYYINTYLLFECEKPR